MRGRWLLIHSMLSIAIFGCSGSRTRQVNRPAPATANRSAATAMVSPPHTLQQPSPNQQAAFYGVSPSEPTGAYRLPPSEAQVSAATAPPPVEPVSPPLLQLNFTSALELGLSQNPDIVALRQNEGVARGIMGVLQTYPFNPYVQVQATPLQHRDDPGPAATYHYVLLIQNFQIAHQQRYRDQMGVAQLTSMRWNIRQAELLNLAQTERLYFAALYLRGIRDLTRDNARLNTELLRVLERRLAAGDVTGADVAIVRLDNQSTQNLARLAEQIYLTALLDLRRQLNIPAPLPFELVGDLTWYEWLPATPERLAEAMGASGVCLGGERRDPLSQIISARPDVMAAQADLATARANARLANASRVPDLQLGPYYQRTESGTQFYGFRGQTDLMVVNTGMPLLRQRQAEVRQRATVWEQLQVRASLEADAAVARYEQARKLLETSGGLGDNRLPIELERLEKQFRAGEVDILQLFTARTSLIQNRRAQLDSLNEVAQAAAQVTAMTGVPPELLVIPRSAVAK